MCFLQGYGKPHELPGKERECETKTVDEPSRSVDAADTGTNDNFPKLIAICKYSQSVLEASLLCVVVKLLTGIPCILNAAPQGISEVACDGEADRLSVAQLYNKVSILLPNIF